MLSQSQRARKAQIRASKHRIKRSQPLWTFCKSYTLFLSFYGSTGDVNDVCRSGVRREIHSPIYNYAKKGPNSPSNIQPSCPIRVSHLNFRWRRLTGGETQQRGRRWCLWKECLLCSTRCDTTQSCSLNRRQAHLSQSLQNIELSYRLWVVRSFMETNKLILLCSSHLFCVFKPPTYVLLLTFRTHFLPWTGIWKLSTTVS